MFKLEFVLLFRYVSPDYLLGHVLYANLTMYALAMPGPPLTSMVLLSKRLTFLVETVFFKVKLEPKIALTTALYADFRFFPPVHACHRGSSEKSDFISIVFPN